MSKLCLFCKATNHKYIMPNENEGKGQEPQSGSANTEKVQENRPRRKRIRQQGSQTDDELLNEGHEQNGCTVCNGKLDAIQEKLDQVLLLIPEVEHMRAKMKQLEEDKESLQRSLEFTQAEVKELKLQIKSTAEELGVTNKKLDKLDQLERRIIKQVCYNRRSNIKFFGIKDSEDESPNDTERKLRQFLKKEMQISNDDLEEMQFERVHRIPTHPIPGKITNKKEQARPIIAKVSFFKDKEFIKSHIKNLPKA